MLIGNAGYESSPLANPVQDVKAFASALINLGFEVITKENCTNREMDEAVVDFWNKLKGKEAGLFYYSGHGLQVNGENYLVPMGAKITKELDIPYECYSAKKIIDYMDDAKARVNIFILDACRNNPFKRSSRSVGGGLAKMEAANQMLIAYATDPDKVAEDGNPGTNSPYMKNILKNIHTPGLSVELFFKQVRRGVLEETKNVQRPWESSCLTDDFVFVPVSGTPVSDFGKNPEPSPGLEPPPTQEVVPSSTPVTWYTHAEGDYRIPIPEGWKLRGKTPRPDMDRLLDTQKSQSLSLGRDYIQAGKGQAALDNVLKKLLPQNPGARSKKWSTKKFPAAAMIIEKEIEGNKILMWMVFLNHKDRTYFLTFDLPTDSVQGEFPSLVTSFLDGIEFLR